MPTFIPKYRSGKMANGENLLLLFCFSFFGMAGICQNQHNLDSLRNEMQKFEAHKKLAGVKVSPLRDSTKANIFYAFVLEYWDAMPDSATMYARQCKTLSERISYKKGMGNACNGFGLINMVRGRNYALALESFQKALQIRTEIGDKAGLGWTYNNMGLMYGDEGNYPESIKSHSKAIKIREEIGDKVGMSESLKKRGNSYLILGNYPEALKDYLSSLKVAEESGFDPSIEGSYQCLGKLYEMESNYSEALKNYISSSKVRKKIGDKAGLANSFVTLGEIYIHQGDTVEALTNFNEAIGIFTEVKNEYGIVRSNSNLGLIHLYKGQLDEALKHFIPSLKLSEELKDKVLITNLLLDISRVYEKQEKYGKALLNMKRALSLSLETGYREGLTEAYKDLSIHYAGLNDFKAAYRNEILFKQAYDSIFNMDNEKKFIGLQMQNEFDKKESREKADQEKKDAITLKELQKQKLLRDLLAGGLAILLIIALIIFKLIIQYREIKLIKRERTRISRELHDDIGSELTRITVISQVLQKKVNDDGEMHEKLRKISEAGKNVLGMIGEIIWTMNLQKDNLENLIAHIREFVTGYLETNGIEVNFEVPVEIPPFQVSGENHRNIFLVVKEAVHNITKYSKATSVDISMDFIEKMAIFEISDNGSGFTASEKNNRGNGLRNMDQRMKDIGGNFRIRSEENLGTFVRLTFPIH